MNEEYNTYKNKQKNKEEERRTQTREGKLES